MSKRPKPARKGNPSTRPATSQAPGAAMPSAPETVAHTVTTPPITNGQGHGATSRRIGLNPQVFKAVFRRNFTTYFANPGGYVFTFLFVLACSAAAFWRPAFFTNNLANLATLNELMPYLLLVFIPAITMGMWAEERRQGTEELLLTLPGRDVEIVLGKYFAALAIYAVSLVFLAIGCVGVLAWLGQPDPGVLAATFLGYFLIGAALIAVGMVASLLTTNITVAFILGVAFCAVPVLLDRIASVLGGPAQRLVENLAIGEQFRPFGNGMATLSGVVYFLSLATSMLYINIILLGRRHWAGGERSLTLGSHAIVRAVSLFVAMGSLVALVGASGARVDTTAERLHTLTGESSALLKRISPEKPVFIQAYLSPEVPREYVQVRQDLINVLREFASEGGRKIRLSLIETERFSDEAREAEKRFGIAPRRVYTLDGNRQESEEIFLGVAFTSGLEEVVVPFFDRGLPVEYEVTRSISTVSRTGRKKVGILQTDAKLLGGFDFQSFGPSEEWQIVTELKKQYDVTSVGADGEIPADIDVLLVAQPSSLPQNGINYLTNYIRKGKPALLLLDPMPAANTQIAPNEPRQNPGGMFGGGPPPEPKGDIRPLLDLIGLDWPASQIVWNSFNPHRQQLPGVPPEIVFIARDNGADEPFNADEIATKGLQELVLIFPGLLKSKPGGPKLTPLLQTDDRGGSLAYEQLMQRGMMGSTFNQNRAYRRSGDAYTVAARLRGKPGESAPKPAEGEDTPAANADINVIAIADLDVISETFFNLRKKPVVGPGQPEFDFDNVTFVLNCVDVLTGDEALVELRKKRPEHRTLTALERQSKDFEKQRIAEEEDAESEARRELDEAQARLDKKVAEVRENKEMDPRTKDVMLANLESVESRRLEVAKSRIEDTKRKTIKASKDEAERATRKLQNQVRYVAVGICPLPVLLLGLGVLAARAGRENRGANPNRLA